MIGVYVGFAVGFFFCLGGGVAIYRAIRNAQQVTESGRRLARSKLLAKRPHSGGHWRGKYE